MKTLGIIVEYNPFHNGHLYHIKKSKNITGSEAVVAVMSGNFMQRGIPAVIDKWIRTEMALSNGVDLVLELPVVYSLSSAEFFAYGAVSILNSIGIVDSICFGSECGDIDILKTIAQVLEKEPDKFKYYLKSYLDKGIVYPSARSKALVEYFKDERITYPYDISDIMLSPNNTLGVEYCRSIIRLRSVIKPFTILREGSGYNTIIFEDGFTSATALRKFLEQNKPLTDIDKYIPEQIMRILIDLRKENYTLTFPDSIFPFLKYKLFTLRSKDSLIKIPDINEGLENKIFKEVEAAKELEEFLQAVKSKRYTYTRINRILCQIFVGFEEYDTIHLRKKTSPYVRVLGFNSKGSELLKEMKKKSTIPFHVKMPKVLPDIMNLDIQSTRAYSLINSSVDPASDFLKHPVIIDI